MATNILMPALSPTMTEGTLARWLKAEGDAIRAGDVIAEIETDKATMEVEAVDEGVLGKILVPDGTQNVKVNDPIAVLVEAGEKVSGAAQPSAMTPAGSGQQSAGKQEPVKQEAGETASEVQSNAAPAAASVTAQAPSANGHDHGDRVFASPLARRMAKQAGIDLTGMAGSGPNGRIVRADIDKSQAGEAQPAIAVAELAAPQPVAAAPSPVARVPAAPINAPHQAVPFNNIRKITARRLAEAKQTIPHFYVSIDVELDALIKLRMDLNAKSPKDGPGAFKLSVNDLLIKAAAVTLRRVPNVNASYTEDALILYDDVDISMAVSIPDGLITPIVRQADRKGLAAISNETKGLIERARAGKLKPVEFQGGSFSISNMGMFGVREFAAIINPPQAAILAVAAAEQRAIVRAGALAIATVMTVTLSVDHRVIDGALAAEWVSVFKRVVEDPLSLML
jgi:pyruvate dehydrogenase E2 component (dihydrolipoamide acetyltransferase)